MLRVQVVLAACLFATPPCYAAEQWQSLGGPLGGDVRCIAVDGVDPLTVYLGLGSHAPSGSGSGVGGGLFYSVDAGDHWQRASLQNIQVSGIVTKDGRIWVSTYGAGVFSAPSPTVDWRTDNGGLQDLRTLCIAATGQRLVLGTLVGAFHSDPEGPAWVDADAPGKREFWDLAQAPWDSDVLLAATDSAAWRSEDGGMSWSFSGVGIDHLNLRSVAIGADGRCWAGSRPGSNQDAAVYCSADTGRTWASCTPLPAGTADGVWSILPRSESVLISTGWVGSGDGRVLRLRDGVSAWEEQVKAHYRSFRALTEVGTGSDRILAGTESCGGVMCSTDGGETWSSRLAGLNAANVFCIELLDPVAGTVGVGEGFSGAFAIGHDWGSSWTRMDSLFPSVFLRGLAVHPHDPQLLYAAAWNAIYRSTNGGESWTTVSSSTSQHVGIDVSPADPAILYAGGVQGVSISRDGGDTWTSPESTLVASVTALAVDPRDGWHALVAADGLVFETHDVGESWDTLSITNCASLAFHPEDPGWVYAGGPAGVNISINGGDSFTYQTEGLDYQQVNAIIADPDDPGIIWAGTPGGVYKSIDGGQTWHLNSDGIANLDVRAFMFHCETRRVFVGGHSGGVHWAFADATPAEGNAPGSVNPRVLSMTISPVPCGDHIHLSIVPLGAGHGESRHARVTLYALDGRRVRSTGIELPGSIVWNLEGMAAGSYLLRAESSGSSAIAPLTVVR